MSDVDVVIPACNAEAYLGEAIGSVLAQSHAVKRIIVVDDGSRDGTFAVARDVAAQGAPVEVLQLGMNVGAGAARNAGIAAANAPFVAFLDADDRWLPDKLALQFAAFDAEPALDFAMCRVVPFASPEWTMDGASLADAALPAAHASLAGWTASALVVRRRVLAEVGGFAEDLRVGEVIDWFSRARLLRHVALDHVGVERRLHANNSTRLAKVTGHDYFDVVRRHRARTRAPHGR